MHEHEFSTTCQKELVLWNLLHSGFVSKFLNNPKNSMRNSGQLVSIYPHNYVIAKQI